MSIATGSHETQSETEARVAAPSFGEAVGVWARIGVLSFGGPAAQIALMHREIVERGWLTERQYTDALAFSMLLPGPEAMQLATYSGWRLHGVRGGLAAGLLFVLPGALVVGVLAALYLLYGDVPAVEALFLGVKAAVLVIVLEALRKVAGRALKGTADWVVAALAFVSIFFLALPFPLVILVAGLWGLARAGGDGGSGEAREAVALPPGAGAAALRTSALWLAIWLVPLLGLYALGLETLAAIGRFFAILAVVTFGGAYAVLAYMAQAAVETHGWLRPGEMMDGLGLAETTPGPLILVTEFVGFLAAARAEGALSLWAGVAGALVTLWATFAPCFGFIFAGAPFVEWIGTRPRLRGALAAITAAVVGVIANLSLWFALHVVFREVERREAGPLVLWTPEWATLDWRAVAIAVLAGLLLFGRGWGVASVLGASALAGLGLSAL